MTDSPRAVKEGLNRESVSDARHTGCHLRPASGARSTGCRRPFRRLSSLASGTPSSSTPSSPSSRHARWWIGSTRRISASTVIERFPRARFVATPDVNQDQAPAGSAAVPHVVLECALSWSDFRSSGDCRSADWKHDCMFRRLAWS